MAAVLKLAPFHGALTTGTTWPTNGSIEGALRREAQARPARLLDRACGRPTLACRGRQGADGRLTCHWDIEVPGVPMRF